MEQASPSVTGVDTIKSPTIYDDTLTQEERVAYFHLIKNLKLTEIATILGVTQPAVSYHLKNWRSKPENLRSIYNYWTKEISGRLMEKSLSCLESLDPEKIPHGQKMTAAAIGIDKLRLLQGESTHNVSSHVVVERIETANTHLRDLAKEAGLTEEELIRQARALPDDLPSEVTS